MVASEDQIRVMIVDDHAVVREGLRTYLELEDRLMIVGRLDALQYLGPTCGRPPCERQDRPQQYAEHRRTCRPTSHVVPSLMRIAEWHQTGGHPPRFINAAGRRVADDPLPVQVAVMGASLDTEHR